MPDQPAQHRYPCERCGASLRFQPGHEMLVCDWCGHRQTISGGGDDALSGPSPTAGAGATGPGYARDVGPALQWDAGRKSPELAEIPLEQGLDLDAGSDMAQTLRLLACPNCGARIQPDKDTHALSCPFCATPVVSDTAASRRIKPQGVLPFRVAEDQAHRAMEDWLGGLWFAPSGLMAYARRGRRMRGVYTPFWTFDARTRSTYAGQRGEHYYETVMVTERIDGRSRQVQRQVRRTRWFPVSGQVGRDFNDVLVVASASLPRRFPEELAPWDLSDLRTYRPDYLAGFEAEAYTVPLADGHAVARDRMAAVILNDVRADIGGDEQRVDDVRTRHAAETFKHVLLPVWTAAYRYNGKSFRFLVNGQSGRVVGERPWSIWKIALAVILGLLCLTALVYLADAGGYIDLDISGLEGGSVVQGF